MKSARSIHEAGSERSEEELCQFEYCLGEESVVGNSRGRGEGVDIAKRQTTRERDWDRRRSFDNSRRGASLALVTVWSMRVMRIRRMAFRAVEGVGLILQEREVLRRRLSPYEMSDGPSEARVLREV